VNQHDGTNLDSPKPVLVEAVGEKGSCREKNGVKIFAPNF
jgi:hypothetical protein